MFLERYGVFVFEFRRSDPLPVVKQILLQTTALMKSGAVRLSAGDAVAEVKKDPP